MQFLACQPDVDPNRIYAFVHIVGDGISAMLSLSDLAAVTLSRIGPDGEEGGADSKLKVELVSGDHFSSFDQSLQRYLDLAE